MDNDFEARSKECERRPTEEEEQVWLQRLVGMKVTGAWFDCEDGYTIEFDDQFRFRSCCPHALFEKRRTQ